MNNINIEKQPILSKILNRINNFSVGVQAYLLVGNDLEELKKCALIFSKVLICPNKYCENCTECNICTRINSNNFGELKIINPLNNVIKKEEIVNLRNLFQTDSVEGKNQVYIINNVDQLNISAANTLLKFLEEPDSNTIAIFTTNNLDAVINTIISRCQIIKLNNNNSNVGLDFVKTSSNLQDDEINYTLDYLFQIENNNKKAFSTIKEFLDTYNTKELLKSALKVMFFAYKDALNYKLFNKMEYFNNENGIKNIATSQNVDILIKKITFILENIKKLEYNVNITLFISNILIGIGEITNAKGCRN